MRRLVATAALAVAVAACGDGSDDTAGTPAAEAPVTTEAPSTVPPSDPLGGEAPPAPDEPVATTATPTSAPTTVPVEVPEKLQHVGDAVGGGELDLSAYAGRDTIAWFWAPW